MTVKVIIEFETKPGMRAALLSLMKRTEEQFGAVMRAHGALGYTFYEVPGDPDRVVEIAEWESVEAREALLKEAAARGGFTAMMELLVRPPKDTYLEQLP